jgi:hypothetical protein
MSLVIAGFPEASAHSTPGKSVEETPSAEHAPRKRRLSTMIEFLRYEVEHRALRGTAKFTAQKFEE